MHNVLRLHRKYLIVINNNSINTHYNLVYSQRCSFMSTEKNTPEAINIQSDICLQPTALKASFKNMQNDKFR